MLSPREGYTRIISGGVCQRHRFPITAKAPSAPQKYPGCMLQTDAKGVPARLATTEKKLRYCELEGRPQHHTRSDFPRRMRTSKQHRQIFNPPRCAAPVAHEMTL
jgi:hypothetical protein